ncbi:MAG: hypothetical protein Q4A34_02085 [Candidatus Saccharibacteria bacterium]|nr:hypothetical protein [Candidatus Saccharibacteria bacterium]
MRKLYDKVMRRAKKKPTLPTRITNDTVAEHREQVLAGGRKHKYPLQYAKNRLVRNALIISVAVLALLILGVWLQLYIFRDTSDIAYRMTRLIPLPVASVDGAPVRYSDYLMIHRSNMTVLAHRGQQHAADKVAFQRQRSMELAVENAYAEKLAKERGIAIDRERVDALIEQQRKERNLSEAAYAAAIKDQLGWSLDEARHALSSSLLKQEVSFAVDTAALNLATTIEANLKSGQSMDAIAKQHEGAVQYVPPVTVAKNNADGGLTAQAAKLSPGATSGIVKTTAGDGYYFIHLDSASGESVTYRYIHIKLSQFKQQVESLKADKKIRHFITL